MSIDPYNMPKVFQLYLEISQYPILQQQIRQRMREEIFARGIVTPQTFDEEVRERAIQSQQIEGLTDPLMQEPAHLWQRRIEKVRDHLTDFYFAYNLPHDLFRNIVREVISQRAPNRKVFLEFNPELAPWDVLFAQGEAYENYPAEERKEVEHHLRQIIVVIIRAMISEQLSFVRVAREYFSVKDLNWIRHHRIGRGKIGGKAAGMLLAYSILQREGARQGVDLADRIGIPESWYLGSDVYYDFHSMNGLFKYMNQKYKPHEQMVADYPAIRDVYLQSVLPGYVIDALNDLLEEVGPAPLIVRSSSLLEDNFDTSFAGKYDSFFLPNQGTPEENLNDLARAIIKVYASVVRPEALIYRERMNLTDYDERMAILIQRVVGQQHGRYFFPTMAGVAFSHNPHVWSPRIRREDGLLRLVTGLGTRAVDRVGSDYPRMVALSHPTLRPERSSRMVRRYSQHYLDAIDLEGNSFVTVPIQDIVDKDFPGLGALMSVDKGGYVRPLTHRPINQDTSELVVTFDRVLGSGDFAEVMRQSLVILQEAYGRPVDMEFAAEIQASHPTPTTHVTIMQCRALSQREEDIDVVLPDDLSDKDVLFEVHYPVSPGMVEDVTHIVYVDPSAYHTIDDPARKVEAARVIGRLNNTLADTNFIMMGPGRWGSSNLNLGVRVTYADIYNARILVEIAHTTNGNLLELSHGTHFFQDLVEANIYPLPLYPDDPKSRYQKRFFLETENRLPDLLPEDASFADLVRVIDVRQAAEGRTLNVVMSAADERAVAYLQ
ncbi:MAG: PEP/pyruvate-binding domain-containing protein [Anaerolineae bacterium]